MRYAEVAVDAPVGYDKTLSYVVPSGMRLVPGQVVRVPLGRRLVQGVVFQLAERPAVEPVREVAGVYGPAPFLSATALEVSRWISRRYLSSLFEAASLMLPPGSRGRSMGRLRPAAGLKYTCRLRLGVPSEVGAVAAAIEPRAPRQAALLRAVDGAAEAPPISQARKEFGDSAVVGLLKKGYLAQEWVRESKPAFPGLTAQATEPVPLALTGAQEQALAEVVAALENGPRGRTFLLHGVTGSGKTEVYLRAVERCLVLGKQALFLVPEISLTPQTVGRLTARFPGRVAVLHSGLTPREQLDRWWQVRQGVYDVVVGPRSALFAPVPRLGLMVLDEEHEWTYKQAEQSPRYHAREVAEELARRTGAVLVMGSATPDVVTYYRALKGRHRLVELPGRIGLGPSRGSPRHVGTSPLAHVQIVDMRRELREGNRSIFSRSLRSSLEATLERGEQVILFLNRRGAATMVQCRDCGYALQCRRCAVPLVYHAGEYLLCHQCNARTRPPDACPQCHGHRIRYLGLGTQRVVEELKRVFPREETLRWDRDAVKAVAAHDALMERFASGAARILVGTQMITKGFHVPSVTLVGVVLADVALYLPDLRAGERIFQLLCQVAGRAGRGPRPGKVVIQTYSPEHYAVKAAALQSYASFYRQEVDFRREHGNPPFGRLAHMVYQHVNEPLCRREAERMGRLLRHQAYVRGMADVEVVGPAPAYPPRVRGRYRWHVIVRAPDPSGFLAEVAYPRGWTWDVDPVSVL